MIQQWLRAGILCVLASLVIAGCQSSGSATPPQAPSPPPEDTTETLPPPEPEDLPPESPEFDANGNPYVPGTMRLLSRTLYFDYDQSVIKPNDLVMLETHAQVLRSNRDKRVVVEGHCDERGTREYNLALGERRADAVRSFLTSAGVYRSQIELVSYGEERPADPAHDESAWARNRRAVLQYR